MKNKVKSVFFLVFFTIPFFGQQVNTLYFLENAPMRHLTNPAFQPISQGYVNFSPLGYMSFHVGNNSLTVYDIFRNQNGKTVTTLYPGFNRNSLLKRFKPTTLVGAEATVDIFSFGFQYKRHGYIHIGLHERMEAGVSLPKDLFEFFINGGMDDMRKTTTLNFKNLAARAIMYSELYGGYSHRINERWIVGGKVKFLLGHVYVGMQNKNTKLDISKYEWYLHGKTDIYMAAPINQYPARFDSRTLREEYCVYPEHNIWNEEERHHHYDSLIRGMKWYDYAKPQGFGLAFDIGAVYSPVKNLNIAFSINDIGFITWNKGVKYNTSVDSVFTGVKNLQFGDYYYADEKINPDGEGFIQDYTFHSSQFLDTLQEAITDFTNAFHSSDKRCRFTKMVSAKLVVGVDYSFCKNILNVGIVSKTRLFDNHLYEELTLGTSVRPVNWFNFALSYSLIQNGHYSNFGAGLSFMPYEGINMTLAMDYIPTHYFSINSSKSYLPYKMSNLNLVLGFSVVWGTNKKRDKDRDGVWDIYDMQPKTPMGVSVDVLGCAYDEDGDEHPDYLDSCLGTPYWYYGQVDSVGCPLISPDSDNDGVPDDVDLCPNTPREAQGSIDKYGCPIDSDGDGIPDYIDKCPNTPKEAYGYIDKSGCPKDTDGDGIPDYLDRCPDTPKEARGYVDEYGCPKDTDEDGVPDYLDKCPFKAGLAEEDGCPKIKIMETIDIGKSIPIHGIRFKLNSNELDTSSYTTLNEWLEYLQYDTVAHLVIEGHTDNTGSWHYNVGLSEKRAAAVRNYFLLNGIRSDRMKIVGYGPSQPVDTNATEIGRAKNRRVAFKVIKDNP